MATGYLFSEIVKMPFVMATLLGIAGAVLRILTDFLKYSIFKSHVYEKGIFFYFVSVILIGAFMGLVLDFNWALSILGGYAGLDILDLLYKTMNKVKVQKKS